METTYSVVIKGLKEGVSVEQAVRQLAALFKATEDQIRPLITVPGHVVKKGIDIKTATRYLSAIEQAGAQAIIEPEKTEKLEFDVPTNSIEGPVSNNQNIPNSNLQPAIKSQTLTFRQKVNKYGGILFACLAGYGLLSTVLSTSGNTSSNNKQSSSVNSPSSQDDACDASKMTVGGCLITAGFDQSDREWEPLSQLLMNGSASYKASKVNGKCIANVHVYGQYKGSSYDKHFSCPIN